MEAMPLVQKWELPLCLETFRSFNPPDIWASWFLEIRVLELVERNCEREEGNGVHVGVGVSKTSQGERYG